MTFSFTSKKSHHTGTTVPLKNGASAMRETVIGDSGALRGLKTWIAVSVTLVALLGVLGSSASAAHAESPWWHLTSGTRPAYLSHDAGLPGEAVAPGVDEVQELVLEGEPGGEDNIVVVNPNLTPHEIEEEEYREHGVLNPTKATELTTSTTEAEAQADLQGLAGYGAGNIQVKRIDATHYKVTFTGALAEQPVAPIQLAYPNEGLGAVTEATKGVLPKGGSPAVNEVQELVLEGEPGEEHVLVVNPKLTAHEIEEEEYREHGVLNPAKATELTTSTTEAEAQADLQGLEGYGAGNIQVRRIDATHFKVTFTGALAAQPVALIQLAYPNEGLGAVTELAKGAAGKPPAEPLDGELYMTAENVGDGNVIGSGTAVKLTDVIPSGLHAVGVAGTKPQKAGDFQERVPIPCELTESGGVQTATCTFTEELAPYDQLEMRVNVKLAGAHSGEPNEFSVSGGNAAPAAVKPPITVSSAPVPFGIENYEMGLEEEGGAPVVQAGAHPFQFTTTIALNQLNDINPLVSALNRPEVTPAALAKDLSFKLPAGLIGNATFVPECTTAEFFQTQEGKENECPPDTAVGVAVATVHEPITIGTSTFTVPVFNLEPRVGEPARFGFYVVIGNSPVFLDTSVRTGSDYGVTVHVNNITQTAAFLSSEVTFWGVPGDSRHNEQRGWGCIYKARNGVVNQPCEPSAEKHPKPLLTLPTDCETALGTLVEGDSWASPGAFFEPFTGVFDPNTLLTGCNRLQFAPEIKVAPDGEEASKPTGLTVDVHVPQEVNSNAAGYSSSNVKGITVQFPEGVVLNPAAADGLQACPESLIGLQPGKGAQNEFLFTSTLPEPLLQGTNFCPDASKIGTVTIKSPLLPAGQNVEGALYLATPAPNGEGGNNPFNALVSMYIVAKDPISGFLAKLPGSVSLNPVTGQITATFENNPQLAFEDAEIHLFGGERAPLATPAHCGTYTTHASFTPWSGTPPVGSSSSFNVTSGPNGTACPGAALPFSPSLAAGTTSNNAGAFSTLTTTISREDGNQNIDKVQLHFPPGLSGILKGVPLCNEAQANAGTCSQASLIGHTIVSVGLGGDPFSVTGGEVFLTEKIAGSPSEDPFGLSIVNPAVAGPFNLGKVIVRATIAVDPHTAQLTVTTTEIPHILDGIPLQIKHVNVTIDRPGFTFNPTNCAAQQITGTIGSVEGASAPVSTAFQATNCANLKFAPKFSVTTKGANSKAGGATLTAKLSEPAGAQGTQANITRVKVDLPKQLPSRLTTLQKACTAKQFELNPANCPKESKIGYAKVTTPLLPVPLEGPAIFVSHGNESFPSLTMVLQGYGITVDLVGTTFISSKGITSTTFKTVPDVPFNTFTLTLGQGKFSALAASVPTKDHYSLCGQTLNMPTEFLAQNGAKINQTTKISVTGCAKKKTKKAKHKTKKAGGGKGSK
jgi:hypothetical protein